MNEIDREHLCLPLLESAPGLKALPSAALSWMAGGCYLRMAARGQVLCEKGQTLAGFFVLQSGGVKLSMLAEDGSERVLEIVLPGQTFAEAAAFLDQACPLHAEALTDCRLVFVEMGRLREAIRRWPEVGALMLTIVAQRTQRVIADLEACCLHSAAKRVADLLLREAKPHPLRPDRGTVTLPAAKTVVASSLNLTAETFSRELHGLASRGLVEVCRREITIPSLLALRTRAGAKDPPARHPAAELHRRMHADLQQAGSARSSS